MKKTNLHIFITYVPEQHQLAHLYEHLLRRQLEMTNVQIKEANSGSGILHFVCTADQKDFAKNIKKLLLLPSIKDKDLIIEKSRLYVEICAKIEARYDLFYQLLQYQVKDIDDLKNKISKVFAISEKAILDFIQEVSARVLTISEKDRILSKIKPLAIKKIDFILPSLIEIDLQNSLTDLTFIQKILRFTGDDVLTANKLDLIGRALYRFSNKEILFKSPGGYNASANVYKGFGRDFYISIAFFCQSRYEKNLLNLIEPEDILANPVFKNYFYGAKEEMLNNLKQSSSNEFSRKVDEVWQKLEWGNYISHSETIKYIESLKYLEVKRWFVAKLSQANEHIVRI